VVRIFPAQPHRRCAGRDLKAFPRVRKGLGFCWLPWPVLVEPSEPETFQRFHRHRAAFFEAQGFAEVFQPNRKVGSAPVQSGPRGKESNNISALGNRNFPNGSLRPVSLLPRAALDRSAATFRCWENFRETLVLETLLESMKTA